MLAKLEYRWKLACETNAIYRITWMEVLFGEDGTNEVLRLLHDEVKGPGEQLTRSYVANAPSKPGRIGFIPIRAELGLYCGTVDDNQPVYSTYGVSLIYPYMLANLSHRVVDMWSEPRAPSPQNSLGTAEMSFQILSDSNVYIEKAVWYGSSPDQLCYDYVAEHDVIADLEVICTGVGAARCMARTGLGVRLNDGPPYPAFQRDTVANVSYSGEFPFPVYVHIIGPSIILKTGRILHVDRPTSQYRDMILREEAAHENQWHGCVTNPGAGLPYFHNGDLPLLEGNVINGLVAQGGVYDPETRTIRFLGEFQSTVRRYVQNAIWNEFTRVNSCVTNRRCLIEKSAKELVGWHEAYTYECTYMKPPVNCPVNPTSPCP